MARIFNPIGANADVAAGEAPPPQPPGEQELWVVHDGRVEVAGSGGTSAPAQPAPDGGIVHLLRVIAGLAVLVLPGVITLRWLMPEAGVAEALGMTPALSLSELTALGIGVLALTRSPFSAAQAWIAVAVAIVVGGLLLALASSRGPAPLRSLQPSER